MGKFRYQAWLAGTAIAVGIGAAILVRLVGQMDDPPPPLNDPAIRNIIALIALVVAGLAAWLWFCFGSPYSRRIRFGFFFASVLSMLLLVAAILKLRDQGLLNFSGDLFPRLAASNSNRSTSSFEKASSSRLTAVDLTSTTPNDFPQFLGPNRNGRVDSVQLNRDWQSMPPQLLWRNQVGAGWSAFAVTNGYAVTLEQRGDEEWVTCYEESTGKSVWGHAIKAFHDTTLGGVGPRSTPTIYEGHVFALGATGVLRCLSQNGQLLWSDDLRQRYSISADEDEQHVMFGRAASPLIVDTLVVVPGGGHQGQAKNLVAFDRSSGQLVWESENKLPGGGADQIAYASPALATLVGRRQILIVNESTVSGHDPATGQRLWSHVWPGRSNGNASVSQAVAINDHQVLLTKGYGGGAELIELMDAGDSELRVKSVWKVARELQTKFSNVVVYNEHAFALSEGILECVALENGHRRWKRGRFGHGQILGVGDLLLVLSEDGELHLVEMNSSEFSPLGSIEALTGKTWNNLCLYGRHLLLRNSVEAVCWELP